MSAANFIPNYIKLIDNINKKEGDAETKIQDALKFNLYMEEMRKKVCEDM